MYVMNCGHSLLLLESCNVAQAHLEMPHGALHTYVALFNARAVQKPCKAPNGFNMSELHLTQNPVKCLEKAK